MARDFMDVLYVTKSKIGKIWHKKKCNSYNFLIFENVPIAKLSLIETKDAILWDVNVNNNSVMFVEIGGFLLTHNMLTKNVLHINNLSKWVKWNRENIKTINSLLKKYSKPKLEFCLSKIK